MTKWYFCSCSFFPFIYFLIDICLIPGSLIRHTTGDSSSRHWMFYISPTLSNDSVKSSGYMSTTYIMITILVILALSVTVIAMIFCKQRQRRMERYIANTDYG